VLLAIGVVAFAGSRHPRLLIVHGHQTAGAQQPPCVGPHRDGRGGRSPPWRRRRFLCPSVGPYAARVRPSAAAKPAPIQRPGLHDPARFLSDGTFGTITRPSLSDLSESDVLSARSTRPPKRTVRGRQERLRPCRLRVVVVVFDDGSRGEYSQITTTIDPAALESFSTRMTDRFPPP